MQVERERERDERFRLVGSSGRDETRRDEIWTGLGWAVV